MRRILFFSFSPLLIWPPIIPLALSKAVNRSIDDTLGDSVTGQRPLFLPPTVGVWEDATCAECTLQPPIKDAYDRTWTAATYRPPMGNMSISFPFTGTAIYVFFILSNIITHNSTTAANFTLDGVVEDAYRHSPSPDFLAPEFLFNESALAFARTGLENSTHNLLISTSGDETLFVNFDYALYTFEEEDDTSIPSSSSTELSSATGSSTTSNTARQSASSTGAIVGGIIGGVIALCALTAVMQRLRKVHQDEMPSIIEYRSTNIPSGSLPSTKQLSTMHRFANAFPSRAIASSSPASGTPEAELHQIRQLELQRQMRAIQEAIENFQNEARLGDQHGGSASYPQVGLPIPSRSRKYRRNRRINETVDVRQLKDQIRVMTEQVAFLQSQQNSAWARGLSDEPPPGYTSHSS